MRIGFVTMIALGALSAPVLAEDQTMAAHDTAEVSPGITRHYIDGGLAMPWWNLGPAGGAEFVAVGSSQPQGDQRIIAEVRALVEDFASLLYTQRNPRLAFERYVAEDYVQHNPGLLDGRDAALAFLEPLFGREGASFDVKRIIIDPPFAVIHLHGRPDPALPGSAVADVYRIEDGLIVEHWDVIQPIQTERINPREPV